MSEYKYTSLHVKLHVNLHVLIKIIHLHENISWFRLLLDLEVFKMKTINIVVQGALSLPLSDLQPLQGNLKDLSDENKAKLRNEIIETGFAFTPHVWLDPSDNKYYLLDGHQRTSVLKSLADDGYAIPPIPVSIIEANSRQEAMRRILQASSQYGEMTAQGLYDFVIKNDFQFDDVKSAFDFPNIDMEKFSNFFETPIDDGDEEAPKNGSKELSEESFSHLQHTCPKCGFEFGKGGTSE